MIGQRISAGGIVLQDGKVLLVRLRREGVYDFWVLPGGGIEGEEGIFRAAEREVWEETGLEVQAEKIAYIEDFIDEGKYVVKFWMACRQVGGSLSLEHKPAGERELVEVGFFSKEKILQMQVFPVILKESFWQDAEEGFPTIQYLGNSGESDRENG